MLTGLMMDRPLLVMPLMQFAADYHSDTPVITRSVEGPIHRTTYAATYQRIQQLAHALVALGIKPGDRVATLAWNTWRHLELYYAVAGIGAVCHTVNPRLSPEQMGAILAHAEDKVLFFDTTFTPLAAAMKAHVPGLRHVVALCDAAHVPADVPGVLAYEDILAPQPTTYAWPEFDENTAASLCYTSGTTGMPKGVLYSHRALVLHSYGMISACQFTVEDVTLPVVPMFHVNAWGMPYAAPLVGAAQVYTGRAMDGPSLFELMDGEGVTCSQGVPTIWMGLIAQMRSVGRKPKSLARVVIGGAAAPESMIAAFEDEFGIEVSHGWGMTEMTPMGVINTLKPKFKSLPRAAQIKQKAKQGRAVFGVDLRIVDDAGAVLPHDGQSTGRLQVRGPWIMKSYFKEEAGVLTPDGWFDTGDIASLDADGYMQITDRAKDIIKSGGEWISSVDLENAAVGHPAVAMAAVIGIHHDRWLERPLLICVPKGAERPTLGEMQAYLAEKVPKWWLPDGLEYVEALPIGATGKIQKTKLREQFASYKFAG
ncbi:MAG: long-chain-fatty-acid--CoA ligase [Rhodospirillaceae bacterium]|nr:long-chain-fatty-acid--CoA ligase [Rhodospirillaceae bacterium]